MSEKRQPPGPNENLRRLMNEFIHNHPGLKINDEIRARLDRIAKAQLPTTWGNLEGRMWGEVEKGLEAAESLPPEKREDYVDAIFTVIEKVDGLHAKADAAEKRADIADARTDKADKRSNLFGVLSLVLGVLSVVLAVAAFF